MRKILTFSFAFLLLISTAFGQIVDPNSPLEKDSSVRYGKLDNGLTYYIKHNNKPEQRAEFYLVTNVGAIQETKAQDGLAHFLEHMALNGTKNLPGKMMLEYFQKVGVEFGRNINAGTGVEQTMYMLNNIPVHRQGIIDTAMLIMHDYSGFVTNDPVEIDKERGVIVEEWRTRRVAAWRMHEKELPFMYKGSKYAECTLIGSKENLETFPPEELQKFYQTWYRPDLQAVIVVGDIDVDAIEKQLKELFADIPARVNPEPKVMPTIPDNAEPIVGIITDPEATNTSINVYFKSEPLPRQFRPLGAAYISDMVESLISSMINERLNDISKQPNSPFIYAGAGFGNMTQAKYAFMAGLSTKESDGIKGFTAVMTELEKAKKFGFTDAEYERAKTNMLRGLERAKDNAESRKNAEFVNAYIYDFLYANPYMTPEYEYNLAKGYLTMISLPMINQSMAQGFNFTKNAVVIYKSIEKEGLVHPTEAQFVEAMAAAASAEMEAPKEETSNEPLVDTAALKGSPVKKVKAGQFGSTIWTLKNGITVIVKPTDYKKEEVLVSLTAKGGRSLIATEDLPSVESNVFALYNNNSGISKFPQTKLQKMLTGKMVSVSPFISTLEQGVSGSGSPKDFETLLQLVYLTYAEPRFVESEFQPGMDQLRAVVPNLVKQPNFIYQTEVVKTLYNNNPRYFVISPEMLDKINFQTLEKNYKMLFSNAAGATVTIVGNINPEEIKPMVEKYIGSIPTGKRPMKWVDDNVDIVKGVVNHPFEIAMTTPKTTVGIIISGDMKYNLENIILMDATNYILDLVYTESIREQEGGTYGVSSYGSLSAEPKNDFSLQIMFDTDPDKAEKLIQLTKDGLNGLAENGPTADQLQKAKENFLKNISENRISNSYWNRCISRYYKYGVDSDTDYINVVNSLTTEKVQNFIKGMTSQGNNVSVVMSPKK